MAMQQVEYEFPDPEKSEKITEVEVKLAENDGNSLEIEGAVGREEMKKAPKKQEEVKKIKAGELEIEVENDVPAKDRGRKKSDPPADVTDEELAEYNDRVKKRIQHFNKGYHDERRAKEEALRQRDELERYTRQVLEENQRLKGSETRSHNTLIESAKKQVESELAYAKKLYKEAYEAGDSDKLLEAQQALNTAQIRADKVAGLKPKALQEDSVPVQQQVQAPRQQTPPQTRDLKAEAWRDENEWFGSDDEMTAYALGYHNKLVKEGVDPTSDEYYEKVNSRMRKMFPEQFDYDTDEEERTPAQQRRAPNVVAPATRSTAPTNIRLTQTQVQLAKRLGVPLEEYAKQAAELGGKRNG